MLAISPLHHQSKFYNNVYKPAPSLKLGADCIVYPIFLSASQLSGKQSELAVGGALRYRRVCLHTPSKSTLR